MLKLKEMTCLVSRWACVLGLLAVPIVGCSDLDGDGGSGGSGGDGGTGGLGGTGGSATVTFLWRFVENNPDGDDPPLEGVTLCVEYADATKDCVMSNAEGKAVSEGRTNEQYTLTIEKEGYEGWIGGGFIGENPFGGSFTPSSVFDPWVVYREDDVQREAFAGQLGTPYPWEGGIVTLGVFARGDVSGRGLAGVSFEPVGSTVGEVGQAFYFDAVTEQYSLEPEETSAVPSIWALPLVQGGFTEVAPGVQQFEVTGAVGTCHGPGFGWPGDTANSIRVPVRAGFKTEANVLCDPL